RNAGSSAMSRQQPRRLGLLAACAPLAGTAIFSGYLLVHFGDALAWVHGQAAWGIPLLGRRAVADLTPPSHGPTYAAIETIVYLADIEAFALAVLAIG